MCLNVKTSLYGIKLANLYGRGMTCFVASEQRRAGLGGGGGRSRAGFGSQTKGATRRCRDGASAFTQAGGHERGGDRKVGGWWRATIDPPKHTRVHTYKLTWAPHKSLSLTAVWVWVAAGGNLSTQLSEVACCNFSSSATRSFYQTLFLPIFYIHTLEWSQIHTNEHWYKPRHFYRTPLSSCISSFTAPRVLLFH